MKPNMTILLIVITLVGLSLYLLNARSNSKMIAKSMNPKKDSTDPKAEKIVDKLP